MINTNLARISFITFLSFFLNGCEYDNLVSCLESCRDTSNCVACSTLSDCGPGYADLNSFNDHDGKTWYSCRARGGRFGRNSEEYRHNCIAYCEATRNCSVCSTYRDCGSDYSAVAHFTGGNGRNWHACESDTVTVGVCREGDCLPFVPAPPEMKSGTISTVLLGR